MRGTPPSQRLVQLVAPSHCPQPSRIAHYCLQRFLASRADAPTFSLIRAEWTVIPPAEQIRAGLAHPRQKKQLRDMGGIEVAYRILGYRYCRIITNTGMEYDRSGEAN